jgi:hypothetical protein
LEWHIHGSHPAIASEETGGQERHDAVEMGENTMWTLSSDRVTVRLALPPLPLAGKAEPICAYIDFDAKAVDTMLERLTILRGQMLPPLPAPKGRECILTA